MPVFEKAKKKSQHIEEDLQSTGSYFRTKALANVIQPFAYAFFQYVPQVFPFV
ncbi:hypothetical protein SRABI96_01056 [Peribacillus sp. Bi96]|nr:hypothetical protein SRABI96_01056 [Peribacillus sp. Bi96]